MENKFRNEINRKSWNIFIEALPKELKEDFRGFFKSGYYLDEALKKVVRFVFEEGKTEGKNLNKQTNPDKTTNSLIRETKQ